MSATARLVVAAPASGHGKTAVAVGLIAALSARGVRPAGFKIGPDHVDAAYLGFAAGTPGRNLDPQLVGAARLAPLLLHGARGRDVAVIEGTMGLYDGLTGRVDAESTAQIAGLLRAPVVLVVDVATMGQSVAALVHGFRAYDEMLWLGGVILNRVSSDRHEQVLREALADLGVPVLGALRTGQLAAAALPPRAAGVVPVLHGGVDAASAVRRLGEVITAQVELDRLLALARSAPALTAAPWSPADPAGAPDPVGPPGPAEGADHAGAGEPVTAENARAAPVSALPASAGAAFARVGTGPVLWSAAGEPGPLAGAVPVVGAGPVAGAVPVSGAGPLGGTGPLVAVAGAGHGDYGYPECRELLVAAGARVVTVDPLRDNGLPVGVCGLVLGDGLPEGYLDELAANLAFLRAVAALAATGAPVVAGPAGLAMLAREHAGRPMAGVLPTSTQLGAHKVLGYREASAAGGSVLAPAGTRVWGYKQHLGTAMPRAGAQPAWHWSGGSPEGFVQGGVCASYLTVHWAGVPGVALRFVAAARRVRPDLARRQPDPTPQPA